LNPLLISTGFDSPSIHGATARVGPWPPLQCASKPLDSLLCLSISLTFKSRASYI
jgi:hypothetical protein